MNPTYDFSGQVALITGAGSGMGLATAHAFTVAGAAVVLADINEAALRTATDSLTANGHRALGHSASPATYPTKFRSPPWSSARSRRSVVWTWRSTMQVSRFHRAMQRTNRPTSLIG
jgi:NAD(P)-dependent dehydrogenase (short-subunit alcohol dehydrogenase family)